jgi:hypothetical protein
MTDELRLGTPGDDIRQAALSVTLGDSLLDSGITIPIPLAGDGMTVPIPAFAAGDDLPAPPIPLYGDDLLILQGGITIPVP